MPDLGEVGEVIVSDVWVEVEEEVDRGDRMVDLDCDKATMCIDAPATGIVGFLVNPGERVSTGSLLVTLTLTGERDEDEPPPLPLPLLSDEDNVDRYWEQYYALSFREKIHEGGVIHWMTSTNVGVLVGLGLYAGVVVAAVKLGLL